MEKLSKNAELSNSTIAQQYKVRTYAMAAIRSLFLSNILKSYEERISVPKLGEISGMPKTDASPAEVKEYIASRRIKNQDWYKEMNEASPAVVQREMLYVLSEIQWQLHQLHVDNERMLQTMTAIGVLNLRASAMFPDPNEQSLNESLSGTGSKDPTADPDYFKKKTAE